MKLHQTHLKFQYRLSIPQFSGSHGSTLILPYTPR